MTKMEIASHLGLIQLVFSQSKDRGDPMIEKSLEAIRAAQLIITDIALKEIKGECDEKM